MQSILSQQGDFGKKYMSHNSEEKSLRGVMKYEEPMSKHTSWHVGGPADRFYIPADVEDLCHFLSQLPEEEPLTWIGLGSNVLVRDGGIRGTVVTVKNVLNELTVIAPGKIRAGAGLACAKVARFAAKSGFGGADFLVGIPGTMGGALAMNAGAFGGETWDIVVGVETVNRHGERFRREKTEYQIDYRSVKSLQREWFLSAELQLQVRRQDKGENTIRELLAKRAETQPMGEASCGSVFRNPEGDYAARLIEASGLKGTCIGKACVSTKHANFIINLGGANAGDIEALIKLVKETVKVKQSVLLREEVQIIGDRT